MPKLRIKYLVVALLAYGLSYAQTGFIENLGQFHENVKYEADFHQFKIYLDQEGFTVLLHDQEAWVEKVEELHGHDEHSREKHSEDQKLAFHSIRYVFEGADLSNHRGLETYTGVYNYFIGQDKSKWASGAEKHAKVLFKNVYPNIDLEFEALDQRFKYNFILNPGADIRDIKLAINGADKLKISDDHIKIGTRFGDLDETMPLSYYITEDGSKDITALNYVQRGDYIGFELKENYQSTKSLVIDPELIFSTYAGNSVDNFGFTATYDQYGNLYSGGIATSPSAIIPNGRYPTTTGAFDQTFNGGVGEEPANLPCDIAISKYNSTGNSLIYATFLGGSNDEYPHSLIVDQDDQLIVFGTTYSFNYPTISGAPQPLRRGGTDLILTKFNAAGSGIIGSTYLGGTSNDGLNQSNLTKYFYADDFRGEVNLDTSNGRIYIATTTISQDFPVTANVFDNNYSGGQEGVIICLSPNVDNLIWCSYWGGSGDDAIYSVDVDINGDLYISGGTSSSDLQSTAGSYQPSNAGGRTDGFMSKISKDGSNLIRTSYYGTSAYDQILSLELDKYGNVFVVGQSTGGVPTKGEVYKNNGSGQFISKFNSDLDELLVSTVYGSGRNTPDITINAFLVDECDKIFVSGWGGSLYHGPQQALKDMPRSPDALQKITDGNDFHLIVFRRDLQEMLYGTYFGGDRTDDHVDGGTSRFDKRGVIYQSVCSSCPPSSDGQESRVSDFPTTSGAYAEKNSSPRCSNASFKLAFGNLNRKPRLRQEIYTVNSLDTLDISYQITDPDDDSIQVWFTYPDEYLSFFSQKPEFLVKERRVIANLSFNPDCSIIGDTITVEVYARDIGCPGIKDSSSRIRIVVTPPPTLPPPGVLCLNFLDKDALRIEWDPTLYSKYFEEMYLYKIWPNGNKKIIDTLQTQAGGAYLDADVIAPRTNNYSYYLVCKNKCGALGEKSYDLSSVKESEFPVKATYLKTVTVEGDRIKVEWLKSTEDDFGHYEIYKSKRGEAETEYVTLIKDIDSLYYYDSEVNVDNTSYCYQIRVSDNCGHLSAKSNIGCSIVIEGDAPKYYFNLYWDEYIDWAGGVQDYQLIRSVDTGDLRPIVRVPSTYFMDDQLDLDWGGYWYSVIAYEGPGSQDATSRSNDIYLIQPPLVFVPNAFTSNGDGLNDYFGWSDAFVLDFKMSVYNRWGQKVFETTDKNAEWDGIFRDNDLSNSNVYIWIVEYSGWDRSKHIQKGTVTIIR
ncbi:gliding motility-associated C-terminal domain-containing protein [bacterium]|nr:gliding motility-associated C-terminal domain-containing protein [bacterium]